MVRNAFSVRSVWRRRAFMAVATGVALAAILAAVISACSPTPTAIPATTAAATLAATVTQPAATATPAPSSTPSTPATAAPAGTTAAATAPASGAVPITNYPPPPTGIPAGVLPPETAPGNTIALAWNDLGMHCTMPDYSLFMILPPYNNFWTQILQRGGEDARVVTQGLTVKYSVPQETNPQAHTNFWQYASAYGYDLAPNVGLTGNGTSGIMAVNGGAFVVDGVPLIGYDDDGTWDPYPFFIVDVEGGGQTVAQTENVAPISTEMRCDFCHNPGMSGATEADVAANILQAHDTLNGTSLMAEARASNPVFCADCHADPAMGVTENHDATTTLSSAMHTFHADKMGALTQVDNECKACHPGPVTECQRGAMYQVGIVCQDCHGTLTDVGDPARTPWVNLPQCQSCHTAQLTRATTQHIDNPNANLTPDSASLYRNSVAHGNPRGTNGQIYCPACHGSPHAWYATTVERDNVQSIRTQGFAGTISDCTVCHGEHPDEGFWHLRGQGGGDD